jgi:hypothetical protein
MCKLVIGLLTKMCKLFLGRDRLPTFIVPIVLFGHLVSIRQLIKYKAEIKTNEKTTTR